MSISVMKRYEMKYLLNSEQTRRFREKLQGHMQIDQYGKTSIASLYYDTPNYQLIRSSLEKPVFKEKIRLRSYGLATEDSPVFLEMKRKANGVVYKRRIQTTIPPKKATCTTGDRSPEKSQPFATITGCSGRPA